MVSSVNVISMFVLFNRIVEIVQFIWKKMDQWRKGISLKQQKLVNSNIVRMGEVVGKYECGKSVGNDIFC